jgi:uncharacterized protein (TIGR03086 family)
VGDERTTHGRHLRLGLITTEADTEDVVDALAAALDAQVEVGGHLGRTDLELDSACPGWTIRHVLSHSIAVTLKFADFAGGATDQPHEPRGDLVGDDHRLALRHATSTSRIAWASVDRTRTCHLGFGDFPAEIAAGLNLYDVLAHTWDVAIPAGLTFELHDDVWRAGLVAARAVIGSERDSRHYGEVLPVATDATPRRRLLAFLGRPDP